MNDRAQWGAVGNAEGQDLFGMRVHDGHYVRACFEYAAVYETLQVQVSRLITDRVTFKVKFDNIVSRHQLRRKRAGHEKRIGILRIAYAHVPVSIDNILIRKNAIRDHEVINQAFLFIHCLCCLACLIP
jgi:hypothetical protein